jgi:hypothetical protein
MPLKTQRSNGDANRPTYGAMMLPQDTLVVTEGGLNINSDGQPEIWDAAGNIVFDIPSALVTSQMVYKVPITAGDGSGVIKSVANPFGYDVYITGAYLRITTQSTGASTLDIGIDADSDTADDGLFDGISGATAGLYTNAEDAGTNGEVSILWDADHFLTVAEASGDVTALVADLYVTCFRLY